MLVLAALQRHYLELLNLDASGQQRKGKARIVAPTDGICHLTCYIGH
jgi:hypothetical protein